MQLRTSPSGPLLRGNAPGDVLAWNGTEWLPVVAAAGAFDHVVESLADLPAPVGNIISLESASYAIKADIDLGPNMLRVPLGVSALIMGMGGTSQKVLSSDHATAALQVIGTARTLFLNVTATAGHGVGVHGTLRSQGCQFIADTLEGAVIADGGTWRDAGSSVRGETEGLRVTDGDAYLSQTVLNGITENALVASGAGVGDVWLSGCQLVANASDVLRWDSSSGNLQLGETELRCLNPGSACCLVLLALTVQVVGGRWESDGGVGLFIDGNVTRDLQLIGVRGEDMSSLVEYNSGTVRQATLQGLSTFSDVAVGVTWAAASIPTNGLSLVGNNFDTATALSGFTAADARVNLKACTEAGALMTETAIVP